MRTRIAELRAKIGLTQEALAQQAGVTRQTILSLERGRYNPSLELAVRITRALGERHVEDVFEIGKR